MATDPCPFCSKRFQTVDFLVQHIARRHSDDGVGDSYDGPGGGIEHDSEGEVRTSRLERQRALWSPRNEIEREMSGARGPSSIKSSMRADRAREQSPGSWPIVINTSNRLRKPAPAKITTIVSENARGAQYRQSTPSNNHDQPRVLRRSATAQMSNVAESRLTWPSTVYKSAHTDSILSDVPVQVLPVTTSSRKAPRDQDSPQLPSMSSSRYDAQINRSDRLSSSGTFAKCPLEECGEQVLSTDIDDHIERHQAEQLVLEGDDPSSSSVIQSSPSLSSLPQSLPIISTQTASQDYRSDLLVQNDKELPNYQSLQNSGMLAVHSYYAPEKSQLTEMGDSNSNARPSRSWSSTPTPPVVQGPSSSNILARQPRRSNYLTDDTPGTNQGATTHSSLSTSLVTTRPKSAMATFSSSHVGPSSESIIHEQTQPKNKSVVALNPRESSSRRQKRQSQIETAITEVKDRVSSFSFIGAVDGLERKLRASREKYESTQLSKQNLGPHAHEREMPSWLYKQLRRGPRVYDYRTRGRDGQVYVEEIIENETPGIVPMLARLSELDKSVDRAYFCHPSTKHVSKIRNEGGFCGYRNIQMQISYLQGAKAEGHRAFAGHRLPGVLELQDLIEAAWDAGIYSASRDEIGRLRGTRKWIGGVEAHALFKHLDISCDTCTFIDDAAEGRFAHDDLFAWIEAYFRTRLDPVQHQGHGGHRINHTLAPPIFLQHPGHSITVVGYEVLKTGQRNLIVLDPMYITSRAVDQLLDVGPERIRRSKNEILQVYRRHEVDFRRYGSIELLFFSDNAPNTNAWARTNQNTDFCDDEGYYSDPHEHCDAYINSNIRSLIQPYQLVRDDSFDLVGDYMRYCSSYSLPSSAEDTMTTTKECNMRIQLRDKAWRSEPHQRALQWQIDDLDLNRRAYAAETDAKTMAGVISRLQEAL